MPAQSNSVQPGKQEAFADMADDLGFSLEHAPFEVGDHTDLGLIFVVAARTVGEFDTVQPGLLTHEDENAQIETIVRAFEALSPDAIAEHLGDYATDPFVLVCSDSLGLVSTDRASDSEVLSNMRSYPLKSPRDSTVSNIQVIHMGGARAAVTYTVDESFTDGTSVHANAAAVLVKVAAGWRLCVVTDHLTS